jgi:hypothetical protein
MRCAKLAIALLGFSAVLMAADSFVGTWKLNPAKSKYKTGAPAKEQTVTIVDSGSDLDVTINGTSAEGTPISMHYTVPASGGEGKIIESPYEGVSAKRMGANQLEYTFTKGGKVALTVHTRVSADGKTRTSTMKGTGPAGKPVDGVNFFDKQ